MSPNQYSTTAKILHWLIALALAFQISLGWRLEVLDKGPAQFWGFQLHKSVGIAILALTLIRIAIRWLHPRPPLPTDSVWAQWIAKVVHFLLYAVMLGGPLTGWAIVSTAKIKFPTLIFGLIPWPHLPLSQGFHEPAELLHGALAFVGLQLILLHLIGALRHQFFKNENLLGRMVPGLGGETIGKGKAAIGVIAAVAVLIGAMAIAKILPAPAAPTVAPQPGFSPEVIAPIDQTAPAPKEAEDEATAEEKSKDEEKISAEDSKPALANWQVAKGGHLGFSTAWTGTPVQGSFGRWNADIRFSPDLLDQSAIRVSVDLASVNTSDSQRDDMLQSDTFFNAAVHPKATFTSKRITHKGGNHYLADGVLALNGKSQPVSLSFTLDIKGTSARVAGSTSIQRLAFGVGNGDYAATDQIPDRVSVSFTFTAAAQPA